MALCRGVKKTCSFTQKDIFKALLLIIIFGFMIPVHIFVSFRLLSRFRGRRRAREGLCGFGANEGAGAVVRGPGAAPDAIDASTASEPIRRPGRQLAVVSDRVERPRCSAQAREAADRYPFSSERPGFVSLPTGGRVRGLRPLWGDKSPGADAASVSTPSS